MKKPLGFQHLSIREHQAFVLASGLICISHMIPSQWKCIALENFSNLYERRLEGIYCCKYLQAMSWVSEPNSFFPPKAGYTLSSCRFFTEISGLYPVLSLCCNNWLSLPLIPLNIPMWSYWWSPQDPIVFRLFNFSNQYILDLLDI